MHKIIQRVIQLIKQTLIYAFLKSIKQEIKLRQWLSAGRTIPPPHFFKTKIIKKYAGRFKIDVFIETGTYQGDTISAVKSCFKEIFSIELDEVLFEKAKNKFAKERRIHILKGDSRKELYDILNRINKPCLFWLDAHYSGGITAGKEEGAPIVEELKCIFAHPVKKHVILIDDARDFKESKGYPSIKKLRNFTLENMPEASFEIKDDIIRILNQDCVCV